ncbi:unnamed protein product [Paramecium pentaurelia]|uniref:RRM domain-containing protein n=1 Tax=Paramecium pentaurelia TaxID=43138 RepID=A0A8S1YEB5_9CILI|nr:unnamed protein product [Paramecium pentaurelia]
MKEYFQQFGLIKQLILRNEQDEKVKDETKVCFTLAFTSFDAQLILQEYENIQVGYQQSKFNISDSQIKIQKLHYKHNEYEKILSELYEEVFCKKEIQTIEIKSNILKNKEHFQSFDQVIKELDHFQQLSQLDQKYIEQQLIYKIVANQSHLNLVDQKEYHVQQQKSIRNLKILLNFTKIQLNLSWEQKKLKIILFQIYIQKSFSDIQHQMKL